MSWEKEISELNFRKDLADALGGDEGVARQRRRNRKTIRERIGALVDPGSFQEVGKLSGSAEYNENNDLISTTPAFYVMGLARINGQNVAIGGKILQ